MRWLSCQLSEAFQGNLISSGRGDEKRLFSGSQIQFCDVERGRELMLGASKYLFLSTSLFPMLHCL